MLGPPVKFLFAVILFPFLRLVVHNPFSHLIVCVLIPWLHQSRCFAAYEQYLSCVKGNLSFHVYQKDHESLHFIVMIRNLLVLMVTTIKFSKQGSESLRR